MIPRAISAFVLFLASAVFPRETQSRVLSWTVLSERNVPLPYTNITIQDADRESLAALPAFAGLSGTGGTELHRDPEGDSVEVTSILEGSPTYLRAL